MLSILNTNIVILKYILLAFLGASFGSFAALVIDRWPKNLSIISPRSHCTTCHRFLPIRHNIPIFSWLFLRGRCAFCGTFYGYRTLILEAFCALSMIAIYAKFGFHFAALDKFIIVVILLILAYIDLDTFCLPYSFLGILFFWALLSTSVYYFYPEWWHKHEGIALFSHLVLPLSQVFSVQNQLMGMLVAFVSFSGLNLVATKILRKTGRLEKEQWAMGFGDPILLAAIGLLVGLSHLFLVVFLASFFGAVVGIFTKINGSKSTDPDIAHGAIPYGPFLAIAAMYVSLF